MKEHKTHIIKEKGKRASESELINKIQVLKSDSSTPSQ